MIATRCAHRLGLVCALLLVSVAARAAPHRDDAMYRAVMANRADALALLEEIVDIDSGTGDVAGGTRVEAVLIARLRALGADVRTETSEAPGLPDSVVAVLRGIGHAKILIIAHIDTVFPPGTAAARPFRVEGNHALGPGVGDEKAGVVNAMMGLSILHSMGFKNYDSITLLLDNSEERGSPGSMGLIKRLVAENQIEFNMEPGDPPDALTVWRKGSANVRIHVRGRSAHAGMAPQDGRNAATELVHQLAVLDTAFPHAGPGTTVNLTLLNGGERANIIPADAEATLNVRYRQPSELAAVLDTAEKSGTTTLVPDTVVTIAQDPAYPPMTENPRIDALAVKAQAIYEELGLTLTMSGNGGASESAIAVTAGIPALDGLGYVGGDFHTDHEWIDLNTVTPRLYLFTRLLRNCAQSLNTTSPTH